MDETGFAKIDRLIALHDNDPEAHRIAGALNQMAGDADAAVAQIDRSIGLNPSDACLASSAAVYRAYAGNVDGAAQLIDRAMAVDPFLPAWCVEDHGVVLHASGAYGETVRSLRRLSVPSPRVLAYPAAALAAQDDTAAAAQFLRLETFKDASTRAGLRGRLHQAGLA